ncbi:unnamed protein product [Thlaspi arvense]|uniref:Ion transport domain-containing protein n=1 Tax=Thlaspi arvense TaxID=13288 RepID=A0AAU9RC58_THLAR|nr:unnamed protein product [Thlaspi arvense]
MIPMDNHCVPSTSTAGFVFPASYGINAMNAAALDSSGSVGGVRPEAALVMDWSVEEQYVLEKGLAKLKDEPKISKYVKIAATLPDKTVRDVALRCRWMTRKRRKREEYSAGKNSSNRKTTLRHGKVVDTSPELNMLSNVPQQNALYVMNNMCHSTHMPLEGLSDAVMDLLQQNVQAFSQISYNLSAYKDNISLFYQARNNISAILTDMKEMPGIMSRMPALPVSINVDLASRLLSSTPQTAFQNKRFENWYRQLSEKPDFLSPFKNGCLPSKLVPTIHPTTTCKACHLSMNSINTTGTVENVEFSIQTLIKSWCRRRKWLQLFIFSSIQQQQQQVLISIEPQWRIALSEFLESYQVHLFTIFLLSLDIILMSLELSSSLLSCTSANKTENKDEWFRWGGTAILSILAVKSMALAVAMGKSFFRQPGCVMDGAVAIIALVLQVLLDRKGAGFIVVVSLWRVLRVVETAFELSDEAIQVQIDGIISQFQALSKENRSLLETLAARDEVIKKLEEELNRFKENGDIPYM